MKHYFLTGICLVLMTCQGERKEAEKQIETKIESTEDLIRKMLASRSDSAVSAYQFVQKTIRYDSTGAVRDSSTWYEAVTYPDKFRIDFGPLSQGSMVLFRSDSAYRYRNFELDTVYHSPQDFLLIEGRFAGCDEVSEVLDRLQELGYDTNEFYHLDSAGVYVLGGNPNDLRKKQIWLDQQHLYMVKSVVLLGEDRVLEVKYEDFKQIGDFWIETTVLVYEKGRLLQEEYYRDIKTGVKFPPGLFNPDNAFAGHWLDEAESN